MSQISPTTFAEHVESSCGALVRDAAPAIGAAIEVLDETGRVVLSTIDDQAADSPKWAFATEITTSGDVIGKLRASTASEATRALLTTLAHDIGTRVAAAVDMERMITRLATCYDELDLLHRMSSVLKPAARIADTCSALVREAAPHVGASTLAVYLRSGDHLELRSEDEENRHDEYEKLMRAKSQYREILASLDDERGDARSDHYHGNIALGTKTLDFVASRVVERDRVVGLVGIHPQDPSRAPEAGELNVLKWLARQLSDVVTRSSMLDELRDMLFNTVKSLVSAVDEKDAYTRGHSERVYRLSAAVGAKLGLSVEELQNLAWAALLHDIGKISIPEEILRKADKLTNDEFRLIQTHPVRGMKLLQPISQLAGVLPGVRSHHERVDGRGYPDQLKGDAIPLIARIIAVADTYDALVSTRAYRRARTRDYALREIERSAGKQLDAEIVSVFLELAKSEEATVFGSEELSDAA